MYKNVVSHFVQRHLAEMVAKSFRNCHAQGVDSIMFDDNDGAKIRLFVAHPHHELWKNSIALSEPQNLSVGLHPHHCDVTLHCVQGTIANVVGNETKDLNLPDVLPSPWDLKRFHYLSPIQTGKKMGVFIPDPMEVGKVFAVTKSEPLRTGDTVFLPSHYIHTIAVDKGKPAAWFVYEGAEDPFYNNVCYSNADLTTFEATGMYEPMSTVEVLSALRSIWPGLSV